MVGDSMINVSV